MSRHVHEWLAFDERADEHVPRHRACMRCGVTEVFVGDVVPHIARVATDMTSKARPGKVVITDTNWASPA